MKNILSNPGFHTALLFFGFVIGCNLLAAWMAGEPIFNPEYWYWEIRSDLSQFGL
jgi:hypothetical protein